MLTTELLDSTQYEKLLNEGIPILIKIDTHPSEKGNMYIAKKNRKLIITLLKRSSFVVRYGLIRELN
jgi:hypothetical protein